VVGLVSTTADDVINLVYGFLSSVKEYYFHISYFLTLVLRNKDTLPHTSLGIGRRKNKQVLQSHSGAFAPKKGNWYVRGNRWVLKWPCLTYYDVRVLIKPQKVNKLMKFSFSFLFLFLLFLVLMMRVE
jgi:hypothetical protein